MLVHGYITQDGHKISKSLGNVVDPAAVAEEYGPDALRYFLLRHVGSHRDGDFTWSRYHDAYEHDLANQLGNLVSRVTGLGRRYGVPDQRTATLAADLPETVDAHLARFEVHRAVEAIWRVVEAANAAVSRDQPWRLAKEGSDERLAEVLGELYGTLAAVADALVPFLPATADAIVKTLAASAPVVLFPRP